MDSSSMQAGEGGREEVETGSVADGEPVEKKRRRKKRKGRVQDETQTPADQQPTSSVPADPSHQDFATEYLQFPDDILVEGDEGEGPLPDGAEGPSHEPPASQPTTTVFVQQTAGFRKAEREKMLEMMAARHKRVLEDSGGWDRPIANTMQAGVFSQRIFHTLGIILQGFLAGFCVCHCVLVFFFTPPFSDHKTFLDLYARLALPTHSIYYLGFLLCSVAAMDRYDIGESFLRVIVRSLTFQSGGVSVLAYTLALVLSLLSRPVEERMSLYLYHNRTHFILPQRDSNVFVEQPWVRSDMNLWKGTLIARAVAGLVGWCLVAARPATHLLHKHMLRAEEDFNKPKSNDLQHQ